MARLPLTFLGHEGGGNVLGLLLGSLLVTYLGQLAWRAAQLILEDHKEP